MWKYLFLADYNGRLNRRDHDNGFEAARRANRAREDDERRGWRMHHGGGRAARPRHLVPVRQQVEEG